MTDLTLGQEIRLGLGALALFRKHADAIPVLRAIAKDAADLWDSVVPPESTTDAPIHEVIAAHLTPEEQAQWTQADRASNPNAGGT